ncbi:DUF3870 domain-containing protein [Neobacillus massiliamazoniensis]|jgi:uncharacterized protein YidB (DUF937 family)|uniref:DUF3870 domain-containing protein n=1 Tax=Neobacillus massiliamazoniensis TaxID=1499688 RepID=A0A0U1NUL2_9BACI|nr:DUF3870 domain-containing protein [Neobacillus massiliamazoniensis]CRK81714.1 hypothetical protein BN000_01625 [Neobacillus massiliamazoniensis]
MTGLKTHFLAGHSRLPQGMAAQSVFDSLTITVEVDKKYGVIVESSCTLATEHGRSYVQHLLKGHSLQDGIDEIIEMLKEGYRGKAVNALIAAIKDLNTQYINYESSL